MDDQAVLETVLAEVAAGRRIAYLGPEVSALSGGSAPGTPAELCARLEAEVRVPRRAMGNLWSVAQYIESRKFRATLEALVRKAFVGRPDRPNVIYDWLARMRVPMVVDMWYAEGILRAFGPGDGDWGHVQGVSRAGGFSDAFTAAYDSFGTEVSRADPAWKTLIYKPNGVVRPGSSFLLSDADYVEVLTEIDIQTPIPEEVQNRRTGRPFLFLGCRFDDQLLRIYARQIAKRSAEGHVAVIAGELTRMEEKFFEELGIRRLNLPLSAVTDLLTVPEG